MDTLATNLNAATAIAPLRDGRILIADQTGKLLVWKNGQVLDRPALTLHVTDYWERGLVGVTVPPDFPLSPHVFVLYVTDKPFVHHVLSRFTLHGNRVDPASEVILLEGDDQAKQGGKVPHGHQGGPLRFGSDGKLYISLGEQTAGEPAQRLDTLLGKILRLNPDGSIPEDNPFYTKTTGKYRAVWAYGIRNSFGIAAQPETGRMFHTEVGGSAFEEVNELVRGANYGWPETEGYTNDPRFRSPLYAFPPVIGRSVTGGAFYPKDPAILQHSTTPFPPKWHGRFFFADWAANWVKALDPDSPTNVVTFARDLNAPVATEIAPDGALLVLNRGTIWRDGKKFKENAGSIVRIRYAGEQTLVGKVESPARGTGKNPLGLPASAYDLPQKWSDLGIEERLRKLPSNRRVTFQVNVSEWQPGVDVDRTLALPDGGKLTAGEDGALVLPPGAVLVRTYRLKGGAPIEHRILVSGSPRGYGASYRINADGREATLVEDGELAGLGGSGAQWFFPPVEDVLTQPTANLAYALELSVRQLNRPLADGRNQLEAWNKMGLLQLDPGQVQGAPRLAALDDDSAPAGLRVRSYLDVNCSLCHRPGGASRGLFDARFTTPLAGTGMLNGELAAGDLGIPGAKIIVPGSPEKSVLLQRLKRTDLFRMPPVQFHNEPSPVVPVLEAWIRSLGSSRLKAQTRDQ